MKRYNSPRLLVFSSAKSPPFPHLTAERGEEEETPEDSSALGTKGVIRGISMKSRLNIARLLSTVNWSHHGLCLHITLTYHECFPVTKKELMEHKKWLRETLPFIGCGIWRLEYQARGAPHWHLLIWIGDHDPDQVELWLMKRWARFSGNSSVFGVMIRRGDEARAAWYLALHAQKGEQSPNIAVGRWWGYIKRELFLAAVTVNLTEERVGEWHLVWYRRLYRRATGCKTPYNGGFSWFLLESSQHILAAWVSNHVSSLDKSDMPFMPLIQHRESAAPRGA